MISNITDDTRMSFIILQSERKGKLVAAEIGVWVGKNAENMLNIDPTLELHCIDNYTNIGYTDDFSEGSPQEVKEKAKERLSKYGDRVKLVYKQSEDAFRDYPDHFFDYIYIDGDHSYYNAYRDMRLWWPKLKIGGLFAGHDVSMPSVAKALLDFILDRDLVSKVKKLEGSGESDWWVVKEKDI